MKSIDLTESPRADKRLSMQWSVRVPVPRTECLVGVVCDEGNLHDSGLRLHTHIKSPVFVLVACGGIGRRNLPSLWRLASEQPSSEIGDCQAPVILYKTHRRPSCLFVFDL